MFTLLILIALAVLIALGIIFSPVIIFVGADVLAVVFVIKIIISCFTKKKRK